MPIVIIPDVAYIVVPQLFLPPTPMLNSEIEQFVFNWAINYSYDLVHVRRNSTLINIHGHLLEFVEQGNFLQRERHFVGHRATHPVTPSLSEIWYSRSQRSYNCVCDWSFSGCAWSTGHTRQVNPGEAGKAADYGFSEPAEVMVNFVPCPPNLN